MLYGTVSRVPHVRGHWELADGSQRHVICIFTRDYTDKDDVSKVRSGLRRLGVRRKTGYTPDIYTYCGVYRENEWGLSPIRYFD
jgi:hypothetical protein